MEDPNNVYNSTKSTDEKHSFEDSVKPSWFTSAANVPCHLHQEQPQGFPDLLQVPKLCLDTRVLLAQIPFGLNLGESCFAMLFSNLIFAIPPAYLWVATGSIFPVDVCAELGWAGDSTTWDPKLSLRQLCLSRYTFG